MKKTFFIILILIGIIYVGISTKTNYDSNNSYIGKYECPENNVILILGKSNNYTIINNLYRDAVYVKGKYSVKNNNIQLMTTSYNMNSDKKDYLKGSFQINKITFYNFYGKQSVFYLENTCSLLR